MSHSASSPLLLPTLRRSLVAAMEEERGKRMSVTEGAHRIARQKSDHVPHDWGIDGQVLP